MRLSSSLWWPSALSSTGWTSSAPSIPRATICECRIVATRGPNAFPSLFQTGPSLTGDFELRVRIGPLSSDATWWYDAPAAMSPGICCSVSASRASARACRCS